MLQTEVLEIVAQLSSLFGLEQCEHCLKRRLYSPPPPICSLLLGRKPEHLIVNVLGPLAPAFMVSFPDAGRVMLQMGFNI